jgi:GNAT superfamily N-acetyltransferase
MEDVLTHGDANWTIRRLGIDDLEAFADLSESRGWGRSLVRWSTVLQHALAWGIDRSGGGLDGTVTLCSYPGGIAALGGMLVPADRERQGIGSRLLRHAVAHASGPVYLYATADGEPIYRRLGFVQTDVVHVHVGNFAPATMAPDATVVSVGGADANRLERLLELDRSAGSGDRRAVLDALARAPGSRLAIHRHQAAGGMAYWANDVWTIGPVIAESDNAAIDVAAALARGALGARCRLDAGTAQTSLREWCRTSGLGEERTLPGMVHGAGSSGWAPDPRRRALASLGFG